MENNKNYQTIFKEMLLKLNTKPKPTLLLHVCCGPCFTIPFEELKDYFDITVMFNNSNIYPRQEHDRRLDELKRYISEVCPSIKIVEVEYDNLTYNRDLIPYADQAEGHERCHICFRKRLSYGFDYAEQHNFDYYGTVMTISRYKNSQDINSIGEELAKHHIRTKWLYADFKKDNGYEKSLFLIREHQMYFQQYCGCLFSYQKYLEKKAKNN
ncbi:MAG: epoxyqueuosine reductase QueH [Bacilli bacterium]